MAISLTHLFSFIVFTLLHSYPQSVAASPQWLPFLSPRASTSHCSWRANDTIGINTQQDPCGTSNSNFESCCSPGNTCYQDGICGFPVGQYEAYYIGGCTDSSYASPQCNMNCTDLAYQNIMYNDTLSAWQCCNELADGSFNCLEAFRGPAPSALVASFTVASSSSTSATAAASSGGSSAASTIASAPASSITSGSSTTSNPSTTASLSSKSSSGLSGGAKAGISVGVVLGVAAAAVAILFFSRIALKKRNANAAALSEAPKWTSGMAHSDPVHEIGINDKDRPLTPHELDGASKPVEAEP